jgi:5S rRNA maturation endonuclease (ribonuclease M5)
VDITSDEDDEGKELRICLAEALLTLANLTIDESKREDLYSRAQTVAGDSVPLDLMDVSE